MLSGIAARLRALFRPASVDREIAEELDDHVQRDIARRIADGASAEDAEVAARRCIGNITLHHENAREAYGWRWTDELRQDLAYAVRQIRRAPALSAVIVGLLALGIGPNAAVIAYVDQLLEHPWPGVTDTEGLYRISFMYQRSDSGRGAPSSVPAKLAPENFDTFRQRQHEFEAVTRTVDKRAALDLDGVHSTVDVQLVTGEYFQVYRLEMAAGSVIPVLDDHAADPPRVVVVNYHFWRAMLGGSPGAIGKTIAVNGVPMTVVGVMPKEFEAPDLTLPYAAHGLLSLDETAAELRTIRGDGLVGRLRRGITVAEAKAGAARALPAILSANFSSPASSEALQRAMRARAMLPIVALLILLIACSNVSILLLGRAVTRRREIAVRLSMGASRARLIRQLVTESLLLTAAAWVAGLALVHAIGTFLWIRYPAVPELTTNWRDVAATCAFAAIVGTVFGLVPALHATRAQVGDALKDSAAGLDVRRSRLQGVFVVAEVALSITLVCAAGLMVNAFSDVMTVDGFAASSRVFVSEVDFPSAHYSGARAAQFQRQAKERIAALPGAPLAGFADAIPLGPGVANWGLGYAFPAGTAMPAGAKIARLNLVDPDYFGAMQIHFVGGRDVSKGDSTGTRPVAIISADIAQRVWPGQTALGRLIWIRRMTHDADLHYHFDTLAVTVIGVAASVRREGLLNGTTLSGQPGRPANESMMYLSRSQWSDSGKAILIVQVAHPSAATAVSIEQELRALDSRLPFTSVLSAEAYHRAPFARIYAAIDGVTWSGVLVLLLACVGVYAVIAFGIGQRTREIGVRLALGARAEQVVWLFFRDGMGLTIAGFIVGVPLALAIMKVTVANELGTRLLAPSAVGAIVAVLLVVAAVASWIPARRAATVDPLTALRSE